MITNPFEPVYGTEGNDELSGFAVEGLGGNDILSGVIANGGDGEDIITANIANGGDGDDTITARIASGGADNDIINAVDGQDCVLFGDSGGDQLNGANGNDYLNGDSSDGTVDFDGDVLTGNGGNDTLVGSGSYASSATKSSIASTLSNALSAAYADGSSGGSDLLTGGTGADTFQLESGVSFITDYDAAEGDVISGSQAVSAEYFDLGFSLPVSVLGNSYDISSFSVIYDTDGGVSGYAINVDLTDGFG